MDGLALKSPPIKSSTNDLPLFELLGQTPSETVKNTPISTSVKKSLDEMFPEQTYEEKEIKRAKAALGSLVDELTPEQLKGKVQELQYLANSWLDDFEREIFNGLTLQELLHEKGNK